jgi:hypothetical protein
MSDPNAPIGQTTPTEPSVAAATPAAPEPPKSWLESLPQDLRADPSIATVPDVQTLAKNYVEAKRAIGAEKLLKPQKNWDQKQRDDFYSALGRPETSEKYEVPSIPEGVPVEIKPEMLKEVKDQMFKMGITAEQGKGLLELYVNSRVNEAKTFQEQTSKSIADAEQALRQKWGQKYDMNMELAKVAAAKYVPPEFTKRVGNDPLFFEMCANVGMNLMEDSATGRGAGELLPPALRAQSEIKKLKADPDFMNRLTVKRESAAAAHWNELHRMAVAKN